MLSTGDEGPQRPNAVRPRKTGSTPFEPVFLIPAYSDARMTFSAEPATNHSTWSTL